MVRPLSRRRRRPSTLASGLRLASIGPSPHVRRANLFRRQRFDGGSISTSTRLEMSTLGSPASNACPRASGLADRHLMRARSEEHTSELQSLAYLVCRLLLEKKKKK